LWTYSVLSGVTVAAFAAGLPWGPLGVVLALAVASLVIRVPILYYLAGRRGPVSTADLWKGFFSHLLCWTVIFVTTIVARGMVSHSAPVVQLLVCAPLGIIAGAVVVFATARSRATALYLWATLRRSLTTPFFWHASDVPGKTR
jgi:PST family polysaccharide transporter